MIKLLFQMLFLLLFSTRLFAQAVTTEVSRTHVSLQDDIEFNIVLEGAFDDQDELIEKYEASLSENFSIVGRSTSQSYTSDFTKIKKTIRISLTLQPRKEGVFMLPEITLSTKGKPFSSLPIRITVGTGSKGSQNPGNSGAAGTPSSPNSGPKSQGPVSIEYRLPGKKFFFGEPIPVEVKIYARSRVRNINHPGQSSPEFRVVSIPGDQQKEEVIQGEQMLVVTLQQILIPIKTGVVNTPVFSADVTFEKQNNMAKNFPFGNFFGNFSEMVTKKISSDTSQVTIEPLPKPIPVSFKDIFGAFKFNLNISSSKITVGETLTITLTVEGEGVLDSMKEVRLPEIFYTHGRVFAEKPISEEKPLGQVLKSKRVQKFAFLPTKDFVLKPQQESVKFESFNFKTKSYETLSQFFPELEVAKITTPDPSPNVTSAVTSAPVEAEPKQEQKIETPAPVDTRTLFAVGIGLFFLGILSTMGALGLRNFYKKYSLRARNFNPWFKNIKKARNEEELGPALREFLAFHYKANPKAWTAEDFSARMKDYSENLHKVISNAKNVKFKQLKKDVVTIIDERNIS